MITSLQDELEQLDEEFTEEKKQLKEVEERLEVLYMNHQTYLFIYFLYVCMYVCRY